MKRLNSSTVGIINSVLFKYFPTLSRPPGGVGYLIANYDGASAGLFRDVKSPEIILLPLVINCLTKFNITFINLINKWAEQLIRPTRTTVYAGIGALLTRIPG